jgi:peptidoglycan/LPS O-acetylase OafA/YrhL
MREARMDEFRKLCQKPVRTHCAKRISPSMRKGRGMGFWLRVAVCLFRDKDRKMSRQHISSLDGLRGIAAGTVVVSHLSNLTGTLAPLGYGAGQVGVMLFFALSGFLMTHHHAHEDFSVPTVRNYAVRRIARIVPLYAFAVAASFAWFLCTGQQIAGYNTNSGNIISHATFIRGDGILWTIPVEVQFYVVFLLIWAVSKRKIIVCLLTLLALTPTIMGPAEALPTLVRCLPFFFFGVSARLLIAPPSKMLANIVFLISSILYVVTLPQMRPLYGMTAPMLFDNWGDPMFMGILFCLVWSARTSLLAEKLLGNSISGWIGKISFSLYLFHYPVIAVVAASDLPTFVIWIGAISCSVALASASYLAIERRLQKWITSHLCNSPSLPDVVRET